MGHISWSIMIIMKKSWYQVDTLNSFNLQFCISKNISSKKILGQHSHIHVGQTLDFGYIKLGPNGQNVSLGSFKSPFRFFQAPPGSFKFRFLQVTLSNSKDVFQVGYTFGDNISPGNKMKYQMNFDCSNNNITSIGGSNGQWQFSSMLLGNNFVANYETKENRISIECKKYNEVWVGFH